MAAAETEKAGNRRHGCLRPAPRCSAGLETGAVCGPPFPLLPWSSGEGKASPERRPRPAPQSLSHAKPMRPAGWAGVQGCAEQEGSRLRSWRGRGITGGPPSKLTPAACPSAEPITETEERDHPCQELHPTAGKKSFQEAKPAPWEEPSRAEMGREGQAWVPAHLAPGLHRHGTLDCRPSAPPCLPGSYRAFASFPEPLATMIPA